MRLRAAWPFGFVLLAAAVAPAQVSQNNWLGAFRPTSSQVACIEGPEPPRGPKCAAQEFAKYGHPAMASPHSGVAFGVSSPAAGSTTVYVWIDNQTDTPKLYATGCETNFLDHIELYDSAGHLLLSKSEEAKQRRCARGEGPTEPMDCSRNILVTIPPHTVRVVDSGDIEDGYTLAPGTYFITPARVDRQSCALLKTTLAQALSAKPSDAIRVSVPAK